MKLNSGQIDNLSSVLNALDGVASDWGFHFDGVVDDGERHLFSVDYDTATARHLVTISSNA